MRTEVSIANGRYPTEEAIIFNKLADIIESQLQVEEIDHTQQYKLFPIQQAIYDVVFNSFGKNPAIILFNGALGTGKTLLAAIISIEICRAYPGIRGVLSRKTYKELFDTVGQATLHYADSIGLPYKHNKKEDWLDFPNGSRLYLRSCDDEEKMKSLELSFFICDEANEITKSFYNVAVGRIGRQGRSYPWFVLLLTNPTNRGHWLYDAFVTDRKDYYKLYQTTIDDNPYTSQEYKDFVKLEYKARPSLYRRYVLGDWGADIQGKPVYIEYWAREVHVSKERLVPDSRYPIIRSWDFGYHRPALLFAQKLPGLKLHILKEYMPEKLVIEKFIQKGRELSLSLFQGFGFLDCCDFQGVMKSDLSEKTRIDIMRSFGIYPRCRKATFDYRISKVSKLMSRLHNGKPCLLIDEKACPVLVEGLEEGYVYAEDPKKVKETRQPAEDGYFEHCLSGETQVRTLNGWCPIKDLVGKEFYTYGYSKDHHRLIPCKASNVRLTRRNAEVWKLVYDDGELIATPDHLIMMRDGSFKKLSELSPGDSLMPFYEKVFPAGHTSIQLNDGSMAYEHLYIYSWLKGQLADGFIIHHKDRNGRNNNPDNLEMVSKKDHYKLHAKHISESILSKYNGSCNPWTVESRQKVSKSMRLLRESQRTLKTCEVCQTNYMGLPKQMYCSKRCLWKKHRGNRKSLVTSFNHKVISVGFHGYEDVYNMEVEKTFNFPANGVMVHNCQDALQFIVINFFESPEVAYDVTNYAESPGEMDTPVYHFGGGRRRGQNSSGVWRKTI